jgi:hypothetical protein
MPTFSKIRGIRRVIDNLSAAGKRSKKTIDDLDAKIDALDLRIDDLERRVEALEGT